MESIYLSLVNIDKQKSIIYNIKDSLDLKCYFSKYLYNINELLLSFNAVLLKKYIRKNKQSNNESWESIFNKGNKKNKITYLLSELFYHDNSDDYYLDLFHRFYLYENLFRHQLSHGWIDIFSNIFHENFNLEIKILPIDYDKSNNVKNFVFYGDTMSLDLTRESLKKDSYLIKQNDDRVFIFEDIRLSSLKNMSINSEVPLIHELVKVIAIDYSYIKQKVDKLDESDLATNNTSLIDFLDKSYNESLERNHMEEVVFSLNKLIEDIYLVLLRL